MFKYFLSNINLILWKLRKPTTFYTCINKLENDKFNCKYTKIDNNWKYLVNSTKIKYILKYIPKYIPIPKILTNPEKDLIIKYYRWYEKF